MTEENVAPAIEEPKIEAASTAETSNVEATPEAAPAKDAPEEEKKSESSSEKK